jgi:hypothetical protein
VIGAETAGQPRHSVPLHQPAQEDLIQPRVQTEWTCPRRCIGRVDRVIEFFAKELDRRLRASPPGIEITGDYRSAIGGVQIGERSERVDQCGRLPPPRFERTAAEQGKSCVEMHIDQAKVPSTTRSALPFDTRDDGDAPLPLERQFDQRRRVQRQR